MADASKFFFFLTSLRIRIFEIYLKIMLLSLITEFLLTSIRFVYQIIIASIHFILPQKAKSVEGDIILITGAGHGIGRLLAKKLADLNATLVLWDIDTQANDSVAREIQCKGKRVYAYTVDISQKESVYKMANRVRMEVGDVNMLINNAGIVNGKKLLDCDDDMIIRTMKVNMISHFWVTFPMIFERCLLILFVVYQY